MVKMVTNFADVGDAETAVGRGNFGGPCDNRRARMSRPTANPQPVFRPTSAHGEPVGPSIGELATLDLTARADTIARQCVSACSSWPIARRDSRLRSSRRLV